MFGVCTLADVGSEKTIKGRVHAVLAKLTFGEITICVAFPSSVSMGIDFIAKNAEL